MDITTKPFRLSHLDIFQVDPAHKAECWNAAKHWDMLGKLLQAGSHIIDGKILYIGAFFYTAPGVVEVWMHPSIYVSQYPVATVKHVRSWLDYIEIETNARRLQTWGANTPDSDRWLTCLGFQREGVLHSYRPDGGDVSVWGRLCKA